MKFFLLSIYQNILLIISFLSFFAISACAPSQQTHTTHPNTNYIPQHNDIDYSQARISLERSACFGTCPVYSVTLYGDGRVVYVGEDFVHATGERRSSIPAPAMHALVDFMLERHYTSLNDSYTTVGATDMPHAITSLTINGQQKRVDHYFGDISAPLLLRQIENRIDRLANSAQWTGQEPESHETLYGEITLTDSTATTTLPRGAVLTVSLVAIARADAEAVTISERRYSDISTLPASYQLDFPLDAIDTRSSYALDVRIHDSSATLLYSNDTLHKVFVDGYGMEDNISVVAAPPAIF